MRENRTFPPDGSRLKPQNLDRGSLTLKSLEDMVDTLVDPRGESISDEQKGKLRKVIERLAQEGYVLNPVLSGSIGPIDPIRLYTYGEHGWEGVNEHTAGSQDLRWGSREPKVIVLHKWPGENQKTAYFYVFTFEEKPKGQPNSTS